MLDTIQKQEQVEQVPYILSGMSFIPCIGIPFGLTTLVWGIVWLVQKKRGAVLLTAVSAVGICITVGVLIITMIMPSLMSFAFQSLFSRSDVMNSAQAQLAELGLNNLVPSIEFYKLQNNQYPETLDDLLESANNSMPVNIYDTSSYFIGDSSPKIFYYQVATDGDSYWLLSVGPDGIQFTEDDIVPSIDPTNTGLRIDPRSR